MSFTQRLSARPRSWWVKRGLGVLGALVIIFYPSIFANSPSTFQDSQWMPQLTTMVPVLVFVIMALGLNVVVGYAGLLDLGYVAFYAAGAYVAGWFASQQFAPHNVHLGAVDITRDTPGIHISPWLLILVGAGFAALLGIVIGGPTLRLRGDYLAIVTLGFGEIIGVTANNGDSLFGANITNGPQGINPIDPPGFGNWLHANLGLPDNFITAANSLNLFYWAAIVLVLFVIFCSLRLRDSKLGRAWVAIREDETAAAAMGVPLMRTKTWAYAIGAFMGGIAGAFLKSEQSVAQPQDFLFSFSIFVLCMVILGGMGSIWGVILGGAFLAYLNIEGIANIGGWINATFGGNRDLTAYSSGIYGTLLVLVMLFRPTGLIPSGRTKAEFEVGVEDQPLVDTRGVAAGT